MSMFDYICTSPDCGLHFEHYFHSSSPAPEESLCECGTVAKLTFEPSIAMVRPYGAGDAQGFTPVVIHKDAHGKMRFPGSADAPCPPGFQRVELTTLSQVRALEREVNTSERSKSEFNRQAQRHVSQVEAKERRDKFLELSRNFSPRGKKFRDTIMEAKDIRQGRLDRPVGEPNFHVDAFSFDSSNRERHSDQRTGWRGRKD